MNSDGGAPRFGRAIVLAPLAAPLSIVAVAAVRAIVSPRTGTEGISPIAGLVFVTMLLLAYGAPLAYGATVVVLWPAAVLLREAKVFAWWSVSLVAGLAGAVLFPLYLRLLDPRATFHFFPGAGFVGGAVSGWFFWFIATRRHRSS